MRAGVDCGHCVWLRFVDPVVGRRHVNVDEFKATGYRSAAPRACVIALPGFCHVDVCG